MKIKYVCTGCGARGCRLYHQYQTCADAVELLCTACALEDQKKRNAEFYAEHPHTIGGLVAACPTDDRETFWGYTSVPQHVVEWWDALPIKGQKSDVRFPDPMQGPTAGPRTRVKHDARAHEVVAVVEATHCETHQLWTLYFYISYYRTEPRPWDRDFRIGEGLGFIKTWEQQNPGYSYEIGSGEDGRPICVSIFYNRINGQLVAFYEATSQLVDHVIVDRWIREQFPGRTFCDAMNFTHAIDAVDEANKKASPQEVRT